MEWEIFCRGFSGLSQTSLRCVLARGLTLVFFRLFRIFGRGWLEFGWLRKVWLDLIWERNTIVLWESGAMVPSTFNKASTGGGRYTESIWHELPFT